MFLLQKLKLKLFLYEKVQKTRTSGNENMQKATITFYNIIRLHFNKNLKIRRKPEESRSFLPRRQPFFPEFRSMVSSGIYFAGVEMLPCKLASAQIDAGTYRCGKNKRGACTESIGIGPPVQTHSLFSR